MRAQIHRNTDAAQIGPEITAPLRRRRILAVAAGRRSGFVAERGACRPY